MFVIELTYKVDLATSGSNSGGYPLGNSVYVFGLPKRTAMKK